MNRRTFLRATPAVVAATVVAVREAPRRLLSLLRRDRYEDYYTASYVDLLQSTTLHELSAATYGRWNASLTDFVENRLA